MAVRVLPVPIPAVIAQTIAASPIAKRARIKIAFTGCARIDLDSDEVEAAVARTITVVPAPAGSPASPIWVQQQKLRFLTAISVLRHVRQQTSAHAFMMGWTPPDGIDVPKWRC